MTIRVAVVGGGKISEEHLKFLSTDRRIEIVGISDLSEALAEYSAKQFGAAASFVDYREMFERSSPEVVHVLTPPQTHFGIIGDALNHGCHVIAEKPLALTAVAAATLLQQASEAGRHLVEDHNYRFNRAVQRIEKRVADGALGRLSEIEVRMSLRIRDAGGRYADASLPHPSHRLPAGVIHEFLPHMVYLLLRFMPEWQGVHAMWSNLGGGDVFSVDDLDAVIWNDSVRSRLRFVCNQYPESFIVTVRGDRGWEETDLFHPYQQRCIPRFAGRQLSPLVNLACRGSRLLMASGALFRDKLLQRTPYEGLHTLLHQCYSVFEAGGEIPVQPDDILATARLTDELVRFRGASNGGLS